ncbi:MAG: CAP domain-containing protein [Acidimicrobiia bacterium]
MRQPHIYALTAGLALTTVLVLVVGGDPAPEPEPFTEAQVLAGHTESTTTTMDLEFSDEDGELLELSDVEIELTEDAAARSTTTTTTTAPITATAPAHSHTPKTPSGPTPTTTAPPSTQPTSPPTTVTPEFRSDYEAEFHGRINSLRASNGLPALARNGSLNARARDWAKAMAESGGLKHSNIGSLVPPWTAAAENVGKGGSVSSIFSLLKGSGSHVSNMVGSYTDVGIGVWRDAGGTLWTVHVFAR